jgi:uncharacterized protein DUF2752
MTLRYSPPPGFASESPPSAPRWRWLERLVALAAGSILLALLVTACCLTPSPVGLGTHRQLGLPPCTVLDWFGFRCPSCGMTTSWAYMLHGRPLAALQANAGGALLAIVAAVCGPWLTISAVRGRWLLRPPADWLMVAVGAAIIGITITQWTVRLSLGW